MRFPALQSRSFRLYEGGSIFSLNGQWITRIVVGWVAWELTQSATWVGMMSFFLFAPTIASSPLFGVLMDRVKLRSSAIISQGIVTAMTFIMLLFYLSGGLNIWVLSVLTLAIGIASSAERAVRMTIVPRMVDKEILPNAIALHATNFNVARLLGPAIGGILIEGFGTGTAMAVNVVVLIPFMIAMFFLEVREKAPVKPDDRNFLKELWDGARHAALHPVIREAMVLTWMTSLTVRGVLEILPALADGEFHRGAAGLGQMVAAGGAGALVAALIIALRPTRSWGPGIPLIAQIAVFVGLFSVTGLGIAHTWLFAMAFVTLSGFCGTMIGINMQSTIQLTVDDAYRGRVMSLWMVSGIGMSALGALLLGALADFMGLPETLLTCGLISVVLVAAARIALARLGASAAPPVPPAT